MSGDNQDQENQAALPKLPRLLLLYERLSKPVLRVAKADLRRDFDKLRKLLEPMQVWFFQKRRVVRLIDKVFDKEFNLRRVEEFRSLIEHRGRATRLRCPTLLCQPVRAGVL